LKLSEDNLRKISGPSGYCGVKWVRGLKVTEDKQQEHEEEGKEDRRGR
jgi:hypothetical protein